MEELIDQTFDIINGYRYGEEGAMTKEIIHNWINQFNEDDRAFLLTELNHILRKRYLTKQIFKDYIKNIFFKDILKVMNEKFKIDNVNEILSQSYFINQQPEGKSQKEILSLFDEVIFEEYELRLSECGKVDPICCIYMDDILCTGDTVFKGISSWLNNKDIKEDLTNQAYLENNKKPLIIAFYAVHILNMKKMYSRMKNSHKPIPKFDFHCFWEDNHGIDNDYINQNKSKLEFVFPQKDIDEELIEICKDEITEKIDNYCEEREYKKTQPYFYRNTNAPGQETFYSSPENRNRFEKIILLKSIELYNLAKSKSIRMRPLGMGLYTDKSFGFGAQIFSWRNVPFNTPLVFWYEHKGWQPLFKRKWSTYEISIEDWLKDLFS